MGCIRAFVPNQVPHTLILLSPHQSRYLLDCLGCLQVMPCYGMDKVFCPFV